MVESVLYRGTNYDELNSVTSDVSSFRNMTWWTPNLDHAKKYSDGVVIKATVNLDDNTKGDFVYNDKMPTTRQSTWGKIEENGHEVYSLGNDFIKNNATIERYTDNIPTASNVTIDENTNYKAIVHSTDGDIIRKSEKVKLFGADINNLYNGAIIASNGDSPINIYYEDQNLRPQRFTNANVKAAEANVSESIKTILNINIDNPKGREAYRDVALKNDNAFITGFSKDDSLFVFGHGTQKGGFVADKKTGITADFLTSMLQQEDLIPKNINNIYTISCYGGLQQPFVLPNGVKVQPLHTSNQKIKYGLTEGKDGSISNIRIGVTDNSSLNDDFKKKFNIQENGRIDVDLVFSPDDFNEAVLNNKAKHGALTSQEAFDRYGTNDDMFYTSQGLDPVQQKQTTEALNSNHTVDQIETIKTDINTKKELTKKELTKKELTDTSAEAVHKTPNIPIKESVDNTIKEEVNVKKFSKSGKIGLAAAIVGGIALYGLNKHNDNEQQYDTNYSQQMAADISSYRYGKRMTGFN